MMYDEDKWLIQAVILMLFSAISLQSNADPMGVMEEPQSRQILVERIDASDRFKGYW